MNKHKIHYNSAHEVDFDKLSPSMRHYLNTKKKNPEALLLYRMGDYYYCFFEDAITIARELELVVTATIAGEGLGNAVTCGLPYHSLERHIAHLNKQGYAVNTAEKVKSKNA